MVPREHSQQTRPQLQALAITDPVSSENHLIDWHNIQVTGRESDRNGRVINVTDNMDQKDQ